MRAFAGLLTLLASLLVVAPLDGADVWTRPFPGVRVLHRTTRNAEGNPLELFAAVIDLCDPRVTLGATAPADGGLTVPAWAARVNAAIAINADYFQLTTRAPVGPARGAGAWWPSVAPEHHDGLILMHGGEVSLLDAPDFSVSTLWADADRRVSAEWTDVIAARERILVAGVSRISSVVTGSRERHPRTAFGLSADRHTLVLLIVDGRSTRSVGANAAELSDVLRRLGASDGVKLDGGGSTTLYVRGQGVLNHPSDGSPRTVANHLGVFIAPEVSAAPRRCQAHP